MQMKAYFKAIEYQLSNFSQEQNINLTKAVLVCKKAQEEIEQNSGPLTPEREHLAFIQLSQHVCEYLDHNDDCENPEFYLAMQRLESECLGRILSYRLMMGWLARDKEAPIHFNAFC